MTEPLKMLPERCWTAASKLESQAARTPGLPAVYRDHAADAFASLRALDEATKALEGPWFISGKTEDERMFKVSNARGFVVAHVYERETAESLVALSAMFGPPVAGRSIPAPCVHRGGRR